MSINYIITLDNMLTSMAKNWKSNVLERAWRFKEFFNIIAIIGMVAYSLPHIIWPHETDELWVRFLGFAICCMLISAPKEIKSAETVLLWYVTLLFMMSFLPFHMLLANNFDNFWLANMTISLMTLSFFVSWPAYYLLSIMGMGLSLFTFSSDKSLLIIDIGNNEISKTFYLLLLIGIIATIITKVTTLNIQIMKKKNGELEKSKSELSQNLFNVSSENSIIGNKLEQALGFKKEILSNVSHEIRTPMHAICQMSELMQHWKNMSTKQLSEIIHLMHESTERLEQFTSNLLDATKIDSDKMLFEFSEHDLTKLLKEVVDEFKIMAQEKDLNIKLNFSKYHESIINLDRIRIKQVIRNLINNAIKFTYKGTIIVSVSKNKDLFIISIKDQGIGIPEDEIENIWDPFVQSSRNKSKAGGTGLGLTICKGIIESHHGEIWVENNDNEPGSCFYISIPTSLPINEHINISRDDKISTSKKHQSDKRTIVIIDDEEIIASSLEILLSREKYCVKCFHNPIEALSFVKNNYQDIGLILLDMMMPEMHGSVFVEKLSKENIVTEIPIIVQTGLEDKSMISKLYDLGVKSYIVKPYNNEVILSSLNKYLN